MSESQILRVVTDIYDAALDRSKWGQAISGVAALTGRGQAALGVLDYRSLKGSPLAIVGYDAAFVTRNYEAVLANDPWAAKLPPRFTGDIMTGATLLEDKEREASFFVNHIARPAGMGTKDVLAAFITQSCDERGALASFGALIIYSGEKEGTFTPHDVDMMQRIRPHLIKALELQGRLEAAAASEIIQQDSLDRLSTGLWTLDQHGHILFANAKALEMQEAPEFGICNNCLQFTDPKYNERLQHCVDKARARERFDHSDHSDAFLLRSPFRKRPLSVLLMPALADAPTALLTTAAVPTTLVSIADHNPAAATKVEYVSRLYNLSRAEENVLQRLVEGLSPAEIANAFEVSVLTVRTQLKSIMDKTDSHSQRELILFVMSGIP